MSSPSTPPNPFKVAVRDLPTTRTLAVPAAFVDAAVKGMTLRDALEGEGVEGDGGEAELELYLDSDDKNVFAHGHIRGTVTVACSRCVAPCAITFDEPVRVTFLPASEMPKKDEAASGAEGEGEDGAELDENDLDVFPFDGESVDLEPLIREQFVLAVPFAPLCREDCLGLCDQCGADKNVAPCSCARPVDPRFAGLQSLKLPS